MSKKPSFLEALNKAKVVGDQTHAEAMQVDAAPARKPTGGRATQKHLGAYFDKSDPILERVAILRARLDMTNSELIEHALNELWARHEASRRFGD